MTWAVVPFLFAFLDRLRGTESTLYVGRVRVGYSLFYSLVVGAVVGVAAENFAAGALATVVFFAGETRNWQEKGYYLNGSRGADTVLELIARGFVWYSPVYGVLYLFDAIGSGTMLAATAASSVSFWLSVHFSAWLWYRYSARLKCGYKYFHIGNAWTLDEALRGFIFGVILVSCVY